MIAVGLPSAKTLRERFNSCCAWLVSPQAVLLLLLGVVVFTGGSLAMLLYEENPLLSAEVVDWQPSDLVVDREAGGHLVLVRRVCATRDIEVRVIRAWVDASGAVLPMVDDWARVKKGLPTDEGGCPLRPPALIYPPPQLSEGKAHYRVMLQSCANRLNCDIYHMPDVEIMIKGGPARALPGPQNLRF